MYKTEAIIAAVDKTYEAFSKKGSALTLTELQDLDTGISPAMLRNTLAECYPGVEVIKPEKKRRMSKIAPRHVYAACLRAVRLHDGPIGKAFIASWAEKGVAESVVRQYAEQAGKHVGVPENSKASDAMKMILARLDRLERELGMASQA